jgi:hypothetical protein
VPNPMRHNESKNQGNNDQSAAPTSRRHRAKPPITRRVNNSPEQQVHLSNRNRSPLTPNAPRIIGRLARGSRTRDLVRYPARRSKSASALQFLLHPLCFFAPLRQKANPSRIPRTRISHQPNKTQKILLPPPPSRVRIRLTQGGTGASPSPLQRAQKREAVHVRHRRPSSPFPPATPRAQLPRSLAHVPECSTIFHPRANSKCAKQTQTRRFSTANRPSRAKQTQPRPTLRNVQNKPNAPPPHPPPPNGRNH